MGLLVNTFIKRVRWVVFCLWILPGILCPLFAGCGDEKIPDEGFFDRYDACERMISLCMMSRDDLTLCVEWVEQNYPEKVDRLLLMGCMENAPDCESMISECNLEDLS